LTKYRESSPRSLKTKEGILSYLLVRSPKRRTVAIHIDHQAQIRVLAPRFVAEDQIITFVRQKTDWVWRTINKMRHKRILRIRHHFVDGEKFLFLGKEYPLYIETNDYLLPNPPPLAGEGRVGAEFSFDGNKFTAVLPAKLSAEERSAVIKGRMVQWYRRQAMEVLGSRVFHYSRLMGLEPLKISVKTQKTLWGSCHHVKKSIHLNWKIVMAPMGAVDYVIVHELSHLKVPNHSPRFWREVEKILPDYKIRRQWLKDNAYKMNLD